jgi:hypothetical protein
MAAEVGWIHAGTPQVEFELRSEPDVPADADVVVWLARDLAFGPRP